MFKQLILALLIFNIAYVPAHPTLSSKFLPYHSFSWRNSLLTILGISALTAGCYYGWQMLKTGSTSNPKSKTHLPIKTNQITLEAGQYSETGYVLTSCESDEIMVRTDNPNNEDAIEIDLVNGIFCLCDGNGKSKNELRKWGATVSDEQFDPHEIATHAAEQLSTRLLNNMQDTQKIEQAFVDFHTSIRDRCQMGSATTAVIACIKNNNLKIAHVGDSCAFHFNHKNQTIAELSRTKTTYGTTAVTAESRYNLGAKEFNHLAVHVAEQSLDNDDLVILASDGITNYLSTGDMVDIIKTTKPPTAGNIAQVLVNQARSNALASRTGLVYKVDDATAIVIRYNGPK